MRGVGAGGISPRVSTRIWAGIAAALIGIAVGSLAACSAARSSGSSGSHTSSRTPSGTAVTSGTATTSATAKPVAASGSSPCARSGGPALAYEAVSSTLESITVGIRCGLGSTLIAGVDSSGYEVSVAWSADDSQLAWIDSNDGSMTVVTFTAGKVATRRHWACPTFFGCFGIAFLGERAVTTAQPTAFPELVVYPASGTGAPTIVPMTGLPPYASSQGGARFELLGSTPSSLVIEWGEQSSANTFLALLYHVDAAGHAIAYETTKLVNGADRINSSPAFNQFVFGSDIPCGNGTGQRQTVDLMNAATGAISRPALPAGQPGYLVQGTWFDPSGTPYVSLAPAIAACMTHSAGTGQAGVAPVVCKLVNGTWVKTGSGVFQAAYGPGNWLAEETGMTGQDGPEHSLTISNGSSRTTIAGVLGFAWAGFPATEAAA